MLKLIKKHDWLDLKAENLLLKDKVKELSAKLENAKAETDEIQKKVDAWQEKKPYCGKHCHGCKHSYVTYESVFSKGYGCYLNAENECYLFTRKEVEEAGR